MKVRGKNSAIMILGEGEKKVKKKVGKNGGKKT